MTTTSGHSSTSAGTTTPAASSVDALTVKHRDRLDAALAAIESRGYASFYPESPSPRVYGENAAADGKAAYDALLGTDFPLETPGADGRVATEWSPYGPELGIRYPRVPATEEALDALLGAASDAVRRWRDVGPLGRTAVCLEVLERLHGRIFELAQAVMHTSGQAFVMAFQAGGAHALDRALEAVAYAYAEQARVPATARWEKPSRGAPLVMEKTFTVVPRGVALVIACNTFPTWNSWPGLFASLATGNAVVVKPHPLAVLPLAITVQVAREVLAEVGVSSDLVTLAAEASDDRLAAALAVRPEVRIVDYTGSTAFGEWLEEHAQQAVVYTEKAGVNVVVVDSTDDFAGMCRNVAFSLALYTGQMCTAPQDVFVPRDGIDTDEGRRSYDEVGAGIGAALDALLAEDAKAVEVLGAVVNDGVVERLEAAASGDGRVVVASRVVDHPAWPDARVRTPLVLAVDAASGGGSGGEVGAGVGGEVGAEAYGQECFGPVAFLVATSSTEESLRLLRELVTTRGGMTASVYSTSDEVLADAREAALDAGVALSENLTGQVFVNQSAAFSDFHGTGANPAANATFTDGAYVASRFRVVQSRRHVPPVVV